jgi:hypothetical protein
MQTQSLTLEELQAKIAALQANSAIQNVNIARELEFLKAHARYAAHLEFYHKYQEWDWIVRQQYMDFVKPLAYEWPIPDDSHGYAFELVNYTPWFAGQINDPNFVVTPDCMKPYDIRGARQTHLTEFVKVENMEQCKLTQKIVDAFQLLKIIAPNGMQGRGFGISRKVMVWRDGQPCDPDGELDLDGFDYEGYKVHLQ